MYVAHIVRIIKNFVAAVRAHGCFSFDVLFIIVCASVTVIFIFIFNFFFILLFWRRCDDAPKKAHFSPRGTGGCKNI